MNKLDTRLKNLAWLIELKQTSTRKKVVFQLGKLIWIHLRKDRFSAKRKGKLMPRSESLFEVIKHVNDNAYKIDLLGDHNISATFNVSNLSPYVDDPYQGDVSENLLQ